jgi:hypothetical protein
VSRETLNRSATWETEIRSAVLSIARN